MSSILLTGGSGRLGFELKNLFDKNNIDYIAPSRDELNILDKWTIKKYANCSLIVHCAAYTDVSLAEHDKDVCYQVNVIGTRNLTELQIPMIYISTDGVFDGRKGNYMEVDYPRPINFYGLTKLLGEYESFRVPGVVIRTSFKPRPFEHSGALVDQYTTSDYVDIMSNKIFKVIKNWDRFPRIIHVGSKKRSIYQLALQTNPNVYKITRDCLEVKLPHDISLNTLLYDKLVQEID